MGRPRKKTPRSIEHRNFKKRHGAFQVWVTADLQFIAFQSNRIPNPFSALVIEHLKKLGAEITPDRGGPIAWLPVKQKHDAVFAMLKLAVIPEACQRCKGEGKISNPLPVPKHPELDWRNGETRDAFEARVIQARDAYCMEHKVLDSAYHQWVPFLTCPACLGSGRVANLETVQET